VIVPVVVCGAPVSVAVYGLARDQSPAMVTNAAFASVHVLVLASGIRVLTRRPREVVGIVEKRMAPEPTTL
jgi:hypothetical protein